MKTAVDIKRYRYTVRSWRIIDADTLATSLIMGFDTISEQSCRLLGIDAPERSTNAGQLVIQVAEKWLQAAGQLVIDSVVRDKFAGRYDGIVWNEAETESLNQYLLKQLLVRAYSGGKRRKWSTPELLRIERAASKLLAA